MSQPWDQRPGEPNEAYRAFTAFRDLGPSRTPELAALDLGMSEALLRRWCDRWRWWTRAHAWDHHQARAKLEAADDEVREMAERQVKVASVLQHRALERLKSIAPAQLSPSEALRYLGQATRLERDARKNLAQKEGRRRKPP